MSRQRPTGKGSGHDSPPDQNARDVRLVPPSTTGPMTFYAAISDALHSEFPDLDPREWEWAIAPLFEGWLPHSGVPEARVRAMRAARLREPNLSDDAWWAYIDESTGRLSEADRQDPEKIVAAVRARIDVEMEILRRAQRAAEPERHGFTEREIRQAVAEERRVCFGPPREPAVAHRLHTSVRTLQSAMKALGMGRWPPANPGAPRRSA